MNDNFIFALMKASHMNFVLFINMFRYIVLGEFKYVSERYEIHDGHFLNGFVFSENTLAPANHEGLFHLHDKIVCIIDIDPLNDYQPRELPPFVPSPYVSTDGVPILTPKTSFCFKLMNKVGNAQDFEDKLVFGSEHFAQDSVPHVGLGNVSTEVAAVAVGLGAVRAYRTLMPILVLLSRRFSGRQPLCDRIARAPRGHC